jgi:hypothetical protein
MQDNRGGQRKELSPDELQQVAGGSVGSMVGKQVVGAAHKEAMKVVKASPSGWAKIGKRIGEFFCHAAGTMIRMEDGTLKAVETLTIGDRVFLGGAVVGRGETKTPGLFKYKGTVVNGRHAVFEDGGWLRVESTSGAVRVDGDLLVYPIVTEHHLLVCEHYIAADFVEVEEDVGADDRLRLLNADTERNSWLQNAEHALSVSQLAA